ncbi:maleylpyruvate isomerase N-terminal domain-containing protein [Microbacterium sp.]|uniref:maleylpyruvate isomerase N-terminal domain-containing protein n=1 Tax=Microbacterium sp. TaxID=51671 RepID=UPI003564BB65
MTGARAPLGGPAEDLLLAYRGTAYFLRFLAQLPEQAYDQPGPPDAPADRRTIIATVGYDARGWAGLAEAIREGAPAPTTFATGERDAAISLGASLPPRALRHLVEHSAVHLAVEWRDLPAEKWNGQGVDDQGAPIAIDRTPWLRARQTWLAAVDLGTGGSFSDFPRSLIDRLRSESGGRIAQKARSHSARPLASTAVA